MAAVVDGSAGGVFRFADLFAGIGGFHLALNRNGGECVFVSEWDKDARATYEANFGVSEPKLFESELTFAGDITKVDPASMPDFDVLCGGFPCQPFSNAGLRKGFDETRGTLFFNIADILRVKQPKAFLLENVRGLLSHNSGETFATIKKVLTEDLGYSLFWKVLKASDFGVPQHRPRLFMVGFRDNGGEGFEFPEPQPLRLNMSDVFGGVAEREVGFTLRVGGRRSGVHDRRNWDSYIVDGEVRSLSPVEGLKMQGFPAGFVFPVSETQAMKQLGNSVAVPVVEAVAAEMVKFL